MTLEEVPQEDLPDTSGQEVPAEDLPQDAPQSGSEVPVTDLPEEDLQKQYGSPLQQAGTIVEQFAKGLAPGAATYAENKLSEAGVPGISPEEQIGRENANPIEAIAGQIGGNIALMAALPEVEFAKLGQIGSKAVNMMIQAGLISGGDEVSKSLLGQGNPADAVAAHIAGSSAIGLLAGGLFGKAEQLGAKGLKALENSKYGTKLSSFISGLGHAATNPGSEAVPLEALNNVELERLDNKSFLAGQKYFNSLAGTAPKYIARIAAPTIGGLIGGPGGVAGSVVLEQALEHIAPKVSQKYVAPALLKAAASGTMDNLSEVIDHATTCSKGEKRIANGIESIFNPIANKPVQYLTSPKDREKLDQMMSEGGLDPEIQEESQNLQQQNPLPGFAQGGEVQKTPQQVNTFAKVFPEQNVLLSATKGRISNYLNSVKPSPIPNKLPYDSDHKNPQQKRDYNKTLDLANEPLSVLNHVKDGTLLPKHMKDFTSMYPELHQHLASKLTERMTKGQLDGEKKPKYKVRQALSLFLGSSLDSTLTQPSMAAAQNVFMQQSIQKQAQTKTASLGKLAQNAQTAEQGREARANKS